MTSAATTAADQATIDKYRADLLSGGVLYRAAHGNRSVLGYQPATTHHAWAATVRVLGQFAGQGDWYASVAHRILGRINLYGTTGELIAAVAEGLGKCVADGYADVIGRSGPEAGRPSDHQHPTTLRQAVLLSLLLVEVEHAISATGTSIGHVPGVGWCLEAIMGEVDMAPPPAYLFPRVRKALEAR